MVVQVPAFGQRRQKCIELFASRLALDLIEARGECVVTRLRLGREGDSAGEQNRIPE